MHRVGLWDSLAEADVVLIPAGVVPDLVIAAGRSQHGLMDLLLGDQDGVGQAVGDVGHASGLLDGGIDRLGGAGAAPLANEHALTSLLTHVQPTVARVVTTSTVGVQGRL